MLAPTVLSLAAAATGAAATAPGGPLLDPLKLCYVSVETTPHNYTSESVAVSGRGFRPGGRVNVTIDGEMALTGVPVDERGELAPRRVSAPVRHAGQGRFLLEAYDPQAPDAVARQRAFVSALAVKVRPRRARPSQRVHFRGRGFTDRGAIYAHYLRRGALLKTVRLAQVSSGACGTFKAHRRQFPFRPDIGTYLLQIDQHRPLTDDGPLVKLSIDVRRRPAQR